MFTTALYLIKYAFAIVTCGVAYRMASYIYRLIKAGWEDAVHFHKNDGRWNVRQNLNALDYRRTLTKKDVHTRVRKSQGSERYSKWWKTTTELQAANCVAVCHTGCTADVYEWTMRPMIMRGMMCVSMDHLYIFRVIWVQESSYIGRRWSFCG